MLSAIESPKPYPFCPVRAGSSRKKTVKQLACLIICNLGRRIGYGQERMFSLFSSKRHMDLPAGQCILYSVIQQYVRQPTKPIRASLYNIARLDFTFYGQTVLKYQWFKSKHAAFHRVAPIHALSRRLRGHACIGTGQKQHTLHETPY